MAGVCGGATHCCPRKVSNRFTVFVQEPGTGNAPMLPPVAPKAPSDVVEPTKPKVCTERLRAECSCEFMSSFEFFCDRRKMADLALLCMKL